MLVFFFFKQKTAYDMRISDLSSDVCSSDLHRVGQARRRRVGTGEQARIGVEIVDKARLRRRRRQRAETGVGIKYRQQGQRDAALRSGVDDRAAGLCRVGIGRAAGGVVQIMKLADAGEAAFQRSEEHTSELQSLMRISYAVFCLKKKKKRKQT